MSYTLYYSAGSCSTAVHVILNEINQPYALVNVNQPGTKTRTPEFLKISPRGTVPVLEIDGNPVHEGAAIITYLCDTHKSDLIPASGLERARALEALMFCNATLHPAYSRAFAARKESDEAYKSKAVALAAELTQRLWNEVEEKLGARKFLAGDNMSAGDILMTVIAGWNDVFAGAVKIGPNAMRVIEAVKSRPSYQKALQEQDMAEQKKAA